MVTMDGNNASWRYTSMENITITDVTVVINNWICLTGFEGPLRGGEKKVERVGREM